MHKRSLLYNKYLFIKSRGNQTLQIKEVQYNQNVSGLSGQSVYNKFDYLRVDYLTNAMLTLMLISMTELHSETRKFYSN